MNILTFSVCESLKGVHKGILFCSKIISVIRSWINFLKALTLLSMIHSPSITSDPI